MVAKNYFMLYNKNVRTKGDTNMMTKEQRRYELTKMLKDLADKMLDDDFDKDDKAFFAETASKVLARIMDLNKAL